MTGVFTRKTDRSLRVYVPKRFLHEMCSDTYAYYRMYVAVEHAGFHEHRGLLVFGKDAYLSYIDELPSLVKAAGNQLSVDELLPMKTIVDNRGRISLPKRFADIASIIGQTLVYCVGVGEYFEIWNTAMWDLIDKDNDVDEIDKCFMDLFEDYRG